MKKRSENGNIETLFICSLLGVVSILMAISFYAMGHAILATIALIAGIFLISGFLLPYLVLLIIYVIYWACVIGRWIGTGRWSLE